MTNELPTPVAEYRRPPITEAVIEVRFAQLLGADDISTVSKVLGRNYSDQTPVVRGTLNVPFLGAMRPDQASVTQHAAFRHTSSDQREILVVGPEAFAISQLPEYPGWATFFARFRRDWLIWKQRVGYQEISQLALRYINRIDIPADGPLVWQDQYLRIFVEVPEILGPTRGYSLHLVLPRPQLEAQVAIASGIVPSPLESHLSVLLDVTVATSGDHPQSDEDIFAKLELFRLEKNDIFESAITDKARELFRQ